MKKTCISLLLIWAAIHISAQSVDSKKISFRNYNIGHIHTSPQVSKQIRDGKLIIDIPKGAPSPKIILDLYEGDSVLDLTSNSHIYLKGRSAYGTFMRIFPMDASGVTLADTGVLNRQKIRCSSAFQWLHHVIVMDTLSNGSLLNNIKQLGIAPDFGTGPVQDLVIELDSILVGSTGFIPTLPEYRVPEGKSWPLNNLDGIYSPGADDAKINMEGLQLNFAEKDPSLKGIRFKVMSGSGDDGYINITNYPIIVVGFKGASNDTLRANLVTSPSNSVISNLAFKKINGDGTTSIDFSNLSSLYSFDKINEIHLFLNDNNSSSGSLTLTTLEAGMGTPEENCSGAIGIFDIHATVSIAAVYPNPAISGEQLMVDESAQSVALGDLQGAHITTLRADLGHITIPHDLQPGLYMIGILKKDGIFYSKLQIK